MVNNAIEDKYYQPNAREVRDFIVELTTRYPNGYSMPKWSTDLMQNLNMRLLEKYVNQQISLEQLLVRVSAASFAIGSRGAKKRWDTRLKKVVKETTDDR